MLRKRRAKAYQGVFTWKGDGAWTLRLWTSDGRQGVPVSLGNLFETDALMQRLQQAGVDVVDIKLTDEACLVFPRACRRRLHPEGKRIGRVLKRDYSTYQGHPVKWQVHFAQYN